MATDYQGNSKKAKEEVAKPAKTVEKIVTGEVVVKKRGLGKKLKDAFILADPKSVFFYVVSDVLVPAARTMILDATYNGMRRMVLGDTVARNLHSASQSRTSYQTPPQRGYSTIPYGSNPIGPPQGPRRNPARISNVDTFLFSDKADAERTLEVMMNIIDQYDVVTLADFNKMIGAKINYTDDKWGWTLLPGADIQQSDHGYLLILPQPEPINEQR